MLKSLCRQACLFGFVVWGVLASACAEMSQLQAVQTALDTTAVATNASWDFAIALRETEQRLVLDRARSGDVSVDEAARLIAEVRATWEPRMHAFRAVRHAHEVAVRVFVAVRDGQEPMSVLIASLGHLIDLYGNLRELIDPAPEEAP